MSVTVSSRCSLSAKMCRPVGKFINGFLWMTRKAIIVLPMSICLTHPFLWRRRITLELDYLPVIVELHYIHYDRHTVLLCSFSVTCIFSLSWWRHDMETLSALLAICAGIHRSPVNSPHKGQWRGALMFSLICAWTNGWETVIWDAIALIMTSL